MTKVRIRSGMNLASEFGDKLSNEISKQLRDQKIDIKFDLAIGFRLTYKVNKDSITKIISEINARAMDIVAGDIADALNAAMSSGIWSGQDPDIVDSGALLRSLRVTREGSDIRISYSEPYAALIHYGGYVTPYGNKSAERVYIPGKPWAESLLFGGGPIAQYDYSAAYKKALASIN